MSNKADTKVFERHYHTLPQETVEYQKSIREDDQQFKNHMAALKQPDFLNEASASRNPSPLEIKKAEDLIQTLHKVEQISHNVFGETLQRRTEAESQLKDLYTQASANPLVMEKLKQKDPELQRRIQEHVEPQKTKSWGLEM